MKNVKFYTIPDIARDFGLEFCQVNYAVKKHKIIASFRAGLVRLFDEKQAKQIAELTSQIKARTCE